MKDTMSLIRMNESPEAKRQTEQLKAVPPNVIVYDNPGIDYYYYDDKFYIVNEISLHPISFKLISDQQVQFEVDHYRLSAIQQMFYRNHGLPFFRGFVYSQIIFSAFLKLYWSVRRNKNLTPLEKREYLTGKFDILANEIRNSLRTRNVIKNIVEKVTCICSEHLHEFDQFINKKRNSRTPLPYQLAMTERILYPTENAEQIQLHGSKFDTKKLLTAVKGLIVDSASELMILSGEEWHCLLCLIRIHREGNSGKNTNDIFVKDSEVNITAKRFLIEMEYDVDSMSDKVKYDLIRRTQRSLIKLSQQHFIVVNENVEGTKKFESDFQLFAFNVFKMTVNNVPYVAYQFTGMNPLLKTDTSSFADIPVRAMNYFSKYDSRTANRLKKACFRILVHGHYYSEPFSLSLKDFGLSSRQVKNAKQRTDEIQALITGLKAYGYRINERKGLLVVEKLKLVEQLASNG